VSKEHSYLNASENDLNDAQESDEGGALFIEFTLGNIKYKKKYLNVIQNMKSLGKALINVLHPVFITHYFFNNKFF